MYHKNLGGKGFFLISSLWDWNTDKVQPPTLNETNPTLIIGLSDRDNCHE